MLLIYEVIFYYFFTLFATGFGLWCINYYTILIIIIQTCSLVKPRILIYLQIVTFAVV